MVHIAEWYDPNVRQFWLTALVAACSEDKTLDCSTSDVTPDQGCAAFADAMCSKLDSCFRLELATRYGDVATCVAREKLSCLAALAAPGTTNTPAKVRSCGCALGLISCTDMYTRTVPASCRADPSVLSDGAPCGQDAQCRSTYCKKAASDDTCGVCASRSGPDGPCQRDDDCDYNMACGVTNQCGSWARAGEVCGVHRCTPPLVCTGTCSPPARLNERCEFTPYDTCDGTRGEFCLQNNSSQVCVAFGLADVGGHCGQSGNPCGLTGIVECTGSAICSSIGAPFGGTCLAPSPDGAACGGPNMGCVAPAICSNGFCALPDYASCCASTPC